MARGQKGREIRSLEFGIASFDSVLVKLRKKLDTDSADRTQIFADKEE